ncbi:MAG TPA: hypothetical protein VMT17_03225 [Anaeromyxobacteraceae bacterium]|nr:hypothetical protein [Anaeromyxobacteraceae bacterium]
MTIRGFLTHLRDRIVRRSQMGKERLDAAFARRELDRRYSDLGEQFYELARDGRAVVPEGLRDLMREVEALAERLAAHRDQLRRLEDEAATPS